MIRVAVFDFDGTLVDSNAIKREGFFRLASPHPEGKAAMAASIGTAGDRRSILSAFADRMASSGIHLSVDELVAKYSSYVDTAVAAAPEVEGARNLLIDLSNAGLKLHLSSATPAVNLIAILKSRGWTGLFDGIHGAPISKTETLIKISQLESASGEEIAVVGDGLDDARAAELHGTQFIGVGQGSYAAANPGAPILPLRNIRAHLLGWRTLSTHGCGVRD